MIVKCGNCQTRFKIPDDKVTDKGVKVRCTKCQNTFRVTKADAQPPLAAAAAPEPDPFAKFGAAADPIHGQETRPFNLPPELSAMQPKVSATGSSLNPSFEAQADLPREAFESPTRIGPPPTARPDRKSAMPGAGPPRASSAPTSLPPSAFDPHAGGAPSKQPSAFNPFDFNSGAGPSLDPGSFDAKRPNAAASSSSLAADPFDFGGSVDVPTKIQSKASAADLAAAAAASSPGPKFDFDSLTAPPPAPAAPPAFQPDPFADDVTSPKASAVDDPFAFAEAAPSQTTPAAPPMSSAGLLGDVPHHDPFANPSADEGLGSANSGSADARAMFDMPSKPAPPPPEPTAGAVPLAAIKLIKMPASEASAPTVPTVPGSEVIDEQKKPGAARRMTGVVMNLAIAAIIFVALGATLLVYMNEGKVELASFQPDRLSAMLMSTAHWTAGDISNGLYDTSGGKPVFFVRGEVRNKGSKAGKVKVRAEILDGTAVIRSAEVYVGAAPTPEDLYSVSSSANVEALHARLQKDAVEVQPGTSAPFMVTFYEFPPDLSPFRLKVTVIDSAAAPETAAR